MFKHRNLSGVTIPELLIGVLVIGIVVAIFTYALGVQRAMSRDAKRISDVSVLRAALSQHWLQKASYPVTDGLYLGQPDGAQRLTGSGFAPAGDNTLPIFLENLPTGPKSGEYYAYRGTNSGYSLRFTTERETAYGMAGTYYAHSSGVDRLDELK